MSAKMSRNKFKASAPREHQLMDTVSYIDESGKIPADQLEAFEMFLLELADKEREVTANYTEKKQWTDRVLKLRKKHKVHPRKAQLKKTYDRLLKSGALIIRNLSLEEYLTIKGSRSLSGVLVISVLMSPYPRYLDKRTGKVKQQRFSCAHNCYYCPNEPGMPRSYLSSEAAVARAARVDFDAIDQFYARANTLKKLGHDVDKVELLILGGTFCQFSPDYSEEYIRDLFWAANTFYDGFTNFLDKRPRKSLEEEIKIQETGSKCRIIGLTLETRPDTISLQTISKFRQYGATRMQIGVQHIDNDVLTRINRGCYHQDTVKAVRLLKNAGYKIDIHLMPNLPGSDPVKDMNMFETMLQDELVQCDQWKVYPCQTVDFSLIKKWYESGEYVPYSMEDLMDVIVGMKSRIHPWIRLNRIFRALPAEHITSGITMSNFRQHMYARMEKDGHKCQCIRCREIGTHIRRAEMAKKLATTKGKSEDSVMEELSKKLAQPTVMRRRSYRSSGGEEVFISIESADESVLMGFVRLRLSPQWVKPEDRAACRVSDNNPFLNDFTLPSDGRYGDLAEYEELINTFPALYRAALVREAHVYGAKQKKKDCGNVEVGKNKVREKQKLTAQNKGYGSKLMMEAEKIAKTRGYLRVAVIAGVGTKQYYRQKLGYKRDGTYMVKDFATSMLGSEGRGAVDKTHVRHMMGAQSASILVVCASVAILFFMGNMGSILLAGGWLLILDYLHLFHITQHEGVDRGLLRVSKCGLLMLNATVFLKYCSLNNVDALGFTGMVRELWSDVEEMGAGGGGNGGGTGEADFCPCAGLWAYTLATYVAAFYFLKMIMVKRMVLLVQNPMFGNECGVRGAAAEISILLITHLMAFTVCEFLVLNNTSSHCTAAGTSGYDATSPYQCHDTFEPAVVVIAIFAILWDTVIYVSFCQRWYAILMVLMEDLAMVLQWQCFLVCSCMLGCVVDAAYQLSVYLANEPESFDSIKGSFVFLFDSCMIATALCMSFTDSLNFMLSLSGYSRDQLNRNMEKMRYSLHAM